MKLEELSPGTAARGVLPNGLVTVISAQWFGSEGLELTHTVPYELTPGELQLYSEVTSYVREEFNRAEALRNDKRAGTVGFALTILQRRLASSPEASGSR